MVFVGLGDDALGRTENHDPEGNAMTIQERGGDDEPKVTDDVVAEVLTLSRSRNGDGVLLVRFEDDAEEGVIILPGDEEPYLEAGKVNVAAAKRVVLLVEGRARTSTPQLQEPRVHAGRRAHSVDTKLVPVIHKIGQVVIQPRSNKVRGVSVSRNESPTKCHVFQRLGGLPPTGSAQPGVHGEIR